MSTKKRRGGLGLIILIFCVLIFAASHIINTKPILDTYTPDYENLVVRYVDVGQGDCEIIQIPDGTNIIIDGGSGSNEKGLLDYIDSTGIKKFDYLIATHPHEDHIGGLDAVVSKYEIGDIYMPYKSSESSAFEKLINAMNSKGIKAKKAFAGVVLIDNDEVYAEFVAPNSKAYDDTNNYSAVLMLKYKNKVFLFTGDAERHSEYEIISEYDKLVVDVLKVGHHGSSTSTSQEFLNVINPIYAVIEVGSDNSYGHPHKETLDRLANVNVYRTDEDGTVLMECDGSSITVHTQR